jgi:trehalose 6-phosphate synthase
VVDDLSVVLVSNRGPVSFVEEQGGFEITRGAGGMAGALDPAARRLGKRALWIAAATSDTDKAALAAGAVDELESQLGYPMTLLDIEPDTYSNYYDVSSNRMLWFAVHCLWDELGIERFGAPELSAWIAAYEPVNARFARAVLESADPDSIVLFQDYHLTLAPGYLRRARPTQTIFHFTHSSFCGPRGMERLPDPIPRQVIEGMLGADLLGFHVAPWVEGFLACCEGIGAEVDRRAGAVTYEGRKTWVREYPIPIDPHDLTERAGDEEALKWAKRFDAHTAGPLIVRADRTEPSKNIVRGFEAFGVLLDRREDLRDRARFVACIYPSRHTMEEYRRYTEQIEAAVRDVNERHPDSIELFLEDDYNRTVGALLRYDVLLVNPIMDGMNLVSKEGPTVNERDGVLVLSSGAGSFEELGDVAVEVQDALDVEATASALERALDMPGDERARRATELRQRVRAHTPSDWIENQLEDLARVQKGAGPRTPPC